MGAKANLPSNLLGRENVRKIALAGLLVGLFTLSAVAAESDHPKAEVYGGYQFTRVEGGYNGNGFNFGATGNLNNYFGITADFGTNFLSVEGASLHNYTYTFGPQLALRANKGYTPFVHALIGGGRISSPDVSGSISGMTMFAGGGVDINMNRYAAFRVGADWMMFRGDGLNTSKNFRVPVGVVFKF